MSELPQSAPPMLVGSLTFDAPSPDFVRRDRPRGSPFLPVAGLPGFPFGGRLADSAITRRTVHPHHPQRAFYWL